MTTPSQRFTRLFERTHDALLAYAVRRVADPCDAADVIAETYLVAWRRLDQVPTGEGERPWLFAVARNVLSNHRRGVRRRDAMVDRLRADLALVVPAPSEPSALAGALARLKPDDKELLLLLAWDGLTQEQAAAALGISHNALRVRLHRARTRLRTHLDADLAPTPPSAQPEGIAHA